MSVEQIRAALDSIDATPRHDFLAELEQQLLATWTDDTQLAMNDVPVSPTAVAPHPHQPRRRWMLAAAAAVVALALGLLAVVEVREPDSIETDTVPPAPPPSTTPSSLPVESVPATLPATTIVAEEALTIGFVGTWTSTDTDGSDQTMEIKTGADGTVMMRLGDNVASVACAGAAATMTGSGQLDSARDLVITISGLTCDDGTEPAVPAEGLGSFILKYDSESDTLTDNAGVVWWRDGAEEPSIAPPESGGMWPQSSLDEVIEAQALADAGDPAYTWQVDPRLFSVEWWAYLRQPGTEIVARFLREQLGWDEFLFNPYLGDDGDGAADGVIRGFVYLRCAPGETNLLYPIPSGGDARGAESCAPTIDEFRYETVSIDLAQLDRRGADGIWVVSRWAMTASFTQADPNIAEAQATARLEDFLQARIDGAGAEGTVEVNGPYVPDEVPLMYATTSGAPYERYEIERVSEPLWPYGWMDFEVRLFADGGETVVEQQMTWMGALTHDERTTTENGKPVAVPYSVLDGEVAVSAPSPWQVNVESEVVFARNGMFGDEYLELAGDPLPVESGCEQGPAPADAAALATSIQSDPDLEVTAPVHVNVGGAEGLVMDVTLAPGASVCESYGLPQVLTPDDDGGSRGSALAHGSRMRLYLLDLPEGLATRILAIAVVAPEARFEAVLESATPIVESIEFHTD